jgi:hypothetical protein
LLGSVSIWASVIIGILSQAAAAMFSAFSALVGLQVGG